MVPFGHVVSNLLQFYSKSSSLLFQIIFRSQNLYFIEIISVLFLAINTPGPDTFTLFPE